MVSYRVAEELYDRFADLSTGIVRLLKASNGPSQADVDEKLAAVEAEIHGSMSTEQVGKHPHVAAWRRAYSACGVKPSKYRSAVESLMRRVAREGSLPRINRAVDVGNFIAIKHVLPVAAYDLATIDEDIVITFADGTEEFRDLASEGVQHPEPGEVIYKNGARCLSRRWNWRECEPTKVTESSTEMVFTIEGLNGIARAVVEAATLEMAELLTLHCGGEARHTILDRGNPEFLLQ